MDFRGHSQAGWGVKLPTHTVTHVARQTTSFDGSLGQGHTMASALTTSGLVDDRLLLVVLLSVSFRNINPFRKNPNPTGQKRTVKNPHGQNLTHK